LSVCLFEFSKTKNTTGQVKTQNRLGGGGIYKGGA